MRYARPPFSTNRIPLNTMATPRSMLPALGAAGFLGLLVLMSMVFRPADPQVFYLALLLAGLTLLPTVVRASAGALDLFEPIVLVSLVILLAYSLRAMYIAYLPTSVAFGNLQYNDRVADALLLTIAGYVALLGGYYIFAGPLRITPLSARWSSGKDGRPRVDAWKIAALLVIGVYATRVGVTAEFGEVTETTTLIRLGTTFVQVAACILALHMAAGDTRTWLKLVVWGVALPLAAWQSLVVGAKTYVIWCLYVLVAASHYVKRRTRLSVLLAVAAVVLLAVFPIVNTFRQQTAPTTAGTSFAGRAANVRTRLGGMDAATYMRLVGDELMTRSNGVDALALSMKYDVSDDLGNPTAYAYIPAYAFVPRLVWPSKPVLDQSVRFGRLLVIGGLAGGGSTTSFGMYHVGDLFVSFGAIGVLVGMAALGCLYRFTYRFFDPLRTPDLGVKFLYILVLWAMLNGFESDIPTTYASLFRSLPIWIVIMLWMGSSAPTGSRPVLR